MVDIPRVVNNFNIYMGETGDRFAGAGSIELPDIQMLTAELNVAGIAGKLEVPLLGHTDSMSTTINAPVPTIEALKAAVPMGQLITARPAIELFDSGNQVSKLQGMVIVMRGSLSGLKLGTIQKGSAADTSFSFALDYIKVTMNKEMLLEIDKLNCIFNVAGYDYLAEVRQLI